MYTSRQFKNEVGNKVSRQMECGARHGVRMKDCRKTSNRIYGENMQRKEITGTYGKFDSNLVKVNTGGQVGAEMGYLKYYLRMYKQKGQPKVNPGENSEISLVQVVKEIGNATNAKQDNIGFEVKKVKDGEAKDWALDADPIRLLKGANDISKILDHRGDVDGEIKRNDMSSTEKKFVSADYRYSQTRKQDTTPFYTGKKQSSDSLPTSEHTGWAMIYRGNQWTSPCACIRDRPCASLNTLTGMDFKTSAVLNGKYYLDSVKWGWNISDGTLKVNDIEIDNTGSIVFTEVAKRWNSLFVQDPDSNPKLSERKEGDPENLMKMPEYQTIQNSEDS